MRGPERRTLRSVARSRKCVGARGASVTFQPQISRDNPLNLSISLGGGRETNQYSPSNGE